MSDDLWMPMSLAADRHQDDKLWKSRHHERHEVVEKRIDRLEWRDEDQEKRLNTGASKMSKLETALNKVLRPGLISTVVVFFCSIGTVVTVTWMLAKYPSRDEFNMVQTRMMQIQDTQAEQKKDIAVIRTTLERLAPPLPR